MGNILQTLQGVLQPQQADPLAQYRPGVAGPGQTEAVMGFPSVMRGGMDERGAIPYGEGPPAIAAPEDVEVVGDRWRPKKPTILGAIADAFLMSQGGKPMFRMERDRMNETQAMEGFTNDPQRAARRMGMIPGRQKDAWEMFNQQWDNETQRESQARMNRSLDMRNEDYVYQMTASMMQGAEPETWQQMRDLAIKRARARGTEVSHLIPEQYDPTSIALIRSGAVKTKDQIGIQQRDRRLDQQEQTIENTEQYRERRLDQIDTAEAGRNARSANRGSGRPARNTAKGRAEVYGNKAFRSRDGSKIYEFDKTGKLLQQTDRVTGKIRFFRVGLDGKPVYVRDGN